jgi:SAM-dependent methyltransferase
LDWWIGGLVDWWIGGLVDCVNIAPSDGVNFLHPQDLEDYWRYVKEQAGYGYPPTPVDKIGDFRHIPVDSESLDYVVNFHVIEHEPNPVVALIEVSRVLREEGIFSCIFPKRNAETTRDVFRPLTPLEYLIQAYEEDHRVTDSEDPAQWRRHYPGRALE